MWERFEQFKSILRAFPRAIFMPGSDLSTLVVQLCPTVGGLICQETVCGYVWADLKSVQNSALLCVKRGTATLSEPGTYVLLILVIILTEEAFLLIYITHCFQLETAKQKMGKVKDSFDI